MENANSYHSYDSYESSGSAARGGWVWGKAALNGHRPNSYHTPAAQRYLLRKYVWCACDPCNKTLPHLRCRLYLPCLRLHRTPFSRQSTAALSDVNTVSFSIHIIIRLKFLWFMLGIICPFLGFVAYPKCMKRKTASGATMRSSLRLSTRGVELCYILNCNEFIGAHPKVPTLRGTTFCDATHGEAVKFFRDVRKQQPEHFSIFTEVFYAKKVLHALKGSLPLSKMASPGERLAQLAEHFAGSTFEWGDAPPSRPDRGPRSTRTLCPQEACFRRHTRARSGS